MRINLLIINQQKVYKQIVWQTKLYEKAIFFIFFVSCLNEYDFLLFSN